MLSKNVIRGTMASLGSVLALSIAQYGQAQESFTVTGPVTYYYNYVSGQYIYGGGTTFEATTTYDSTSPLTETYIGDGSYYDNNYAYSTWRNSVSHTVYTVFDSAGNVVHTDEVRNSGVDNNFYSGTERFVGDSSSYKNWWIQDYNGSSGHYAQTYWVNYGYDETFSVVDELAEVTTYPDPLDNAGWALGYFYAGDFDYVANQGHYFGGSVSKVTDRNRDTDGDGINDDVDACVESDLSATVVVGSNDSKVGNTLLGNGCTITDMINVVRADESIHGQRVSGVAEFLNAIRNDGVITGKQRGAIQNAVARAK